MKEFKKILLLFVLAIVFIPKDVFAQNYKVDDNMSINIDNSLWYVFTRDNIQDNKELESLGLTYEYMNNFFITNSAYLDASLFYHDSNEYIELFVKREKSLKIVNSSNYSDTELINNVKSMIINPSKLEIYNNNDYKYVYANFISGDYNMASYVVFINGYSYIIILQKPTDFDSDNLMRFKEIVDSIKFNVDTSLKEPDSGSNGGTTPSNKSSSSDNFFNTIVGKSIIGGLIGAAVGGVIALIFAVIKKGKKNNVPVNQYQTPNGFDNYGGNNMNNNYNNQIPQNYNNPNMNYNNNNYGNNNPYYNGDSNSNNLGNNGYNNNNSNNNNNNNNGMY